LLEFVAVARERADVVGRFVREHTIETNVVQRCSALLPVSLAVAREVGRPLELFELGCSAGLNLRTISTIHLPLERRRRVKEILATVPGIVYVETPTPEEHNLRGRQYPLAIDGRIAAEMDNGGGWLAWQG
jgi:Uncharacterized protein conserved in bacteria (DUF2332)